MLGLRREAGAILFQFVLRGRGEQRHTSSLCRSLDAISTRSSALGAAPVFSIALARCFLSSCSDGHVFGRGGGGGFGGSVTLVWCLRRTAHQSEDVSCFGRLLGSSVHLHMVPWQLHCQLRWVRGLCEPAPPPLCCLLRRFFLRQPLSLNISGNKPGGLNSIRTQLLFARQCHTAGRY